MDNFKNRISEKNFEEISKYFQSNIGKRKTSTTKSYDEFIVLTKNIIMTQRGDNTFFTFQLIKDNTGDEFYNLILTVNEQEEITRSEIYEYIPSIPYNSAEPSKFIGSVRSYPNTNIDISTLLNNRDENRCVVDTVESWECSFGNNHAPGECNGTSFTYIIRLIYGPCSTSPEFVDVGDGGGSGNNDPSNPPIGGGVSDPNDNDDSDDSTDTSPINEPVDYVQKIIDCIDENNFIGEDNFALTVDQINWLNSASNGALIPIDFFLSSNSCSLEAQAFVIDFMDIAMEIPGARFDRYEELMDLIEADPWALIRDCVQENGMDIANYQHLYDHTLPQVCLDKLDAYGEGFGDQPLNTGNAATANVDYYAVEVTVNPDFNMDGNPDSNAEVFAAYRQNFTGWASGSKDDFQFACNVPFNNNNQGFVSWTFSPYYPVDGTIWNSSNPLTALIEIDAYSDVFMGSMVSDDGAIMISEYTSQYWIGSTVQTFRTGTQPFSGNRQWGWLINENGNLELYTRAVDVARISNVVSLSPGEDECKEDSYYDIGETTWSNLADQIKEFVNAFGGEADIAEKKAVRFNKEKLKELLESRESIDQINCN